MDGQQFIDHFKKLANDYPIVSIEDPFDQDDFDAYVLMTE